MSYYCLSAYRWGDFPVGNLSADSLSADGLSAGGLSAGGLYVGGLYIGLSAGDLSADVPIALCAEHLSADVLIVPRPLPAISLSWIFESLYP